MEGAEDYDRLYFESLCRWLWEKQKEVTQPRKFWISDICYKAGPVKFVEHVQLYIDSLSASDIELTSDYTSVKVYPHRKES